MQHDLNIKNLTFNKNEYTSCFFISCVKYTWKFSYNNKFHTIFLFYIKIFGKRQIILDNKKIYDKRQFIPDFQISFPIEFLNITICQKENCFILKINDVSFNKIINDLKLKKFNVLEDNYKLKQEEKKKKRLQKRKNKILLKTVENFGKNKKDFYEINLNNEIVEEDDSKTIHQSFEINDKDLDIINRLNKNYNGPNRKKSLNNSNESERKSKNKNFYLNEKKNHNDFGTIENSFNYTIGNILLGNESIISSDIGSTNIYENNISPSKHNKENK